MKRILMFLFAGFVIMKMSPLIMLLLMYLAIYMMSDYDPALKVKMNAHQERMIDLTESYFTDLMHTIPFSQIAAYALCFVCAVSILFILKYFFKSMKMNSRPKEV